MLSKAGEAADGDDDDDDDDDEEDDDDDEGESLSSWCAGMPE